MIDERWWLGVPLAERPRRMPVDANACDLSDRRLRAWRSGAVVRGHPGPPPTWSIGPADGADLAGATPHQLRTLVPEPPDWVAIIVRAWQDFPPSGPAEPATPAERLLAWVRPLVGWARQELHDRLAQFVDLPLVDSDHPLFAEDDEHLLSMTKRVLALELGAARVAQTLPAGTPEERFQSFARRLVDPGEALSLLAGYPVLGRELVSHLRAWVTVREELARRLHEDREALHRTFGTPAAGLGAVSAIRFGLGDKHRGGRSVAIVGFDEGSHVVYKPRSLAVEDHFNALLRWLNGRGPTYALRPVEVLDRGSYGWAEYVTAAPCRDQDELARFFWRQGSHLAVFHLLRAFDLHAWNLIAAGEYPAYIDLEALFRDRRQEPVDLAAGSAGRALADSVLTVQLLPRRIDETRSSRGANFGVCGLAGGAEPGDRAWLRLTSYAGEGTDDLRTTRSPQPMEPSHNRPRVVGDPAPALVDAPAVLAGFDETYRLLMTNVQALGRADGPLAAFTADEVRVVLRNTRFYTAVLDQLWHPDLLRDSFDREIYLQFLTAGLSGLPERQAAVASEISQLQRQDIPVFTTRPGDGILCDPRGRLGGDGDPRGSGLTAVYGRLHQLSEEDLDRQKWFIRASLCTQLPFVPALPAPATSDAMDLDLIAAAARMIGDRLIGTALPDLVDGTVEWLSLHRAGPRGWAVSATPLGLGAGACGIALFLAELGEVTGEARYESIARDVVEGLVSADRMPAVEDLALMGIGAYTDLGAVLHLLLRLSGLWADPALLARTDPLIEAMVSALSADGVPSDLVNGAAGAGLTAARLHAARPSVATASAMRLARGNLAEGAPRAGFGGGLAGWAYACARMVEADPDPAGDGQASRLVDRFLTTSGSDEPSWGTGLIGTALGALAIAAMPRMASARDALLLRAGEELRRMPAVDNDCLEHGSLGVAEALAEAGRQFDDPRLRRRAAQTANAVAFRVLQGDIRTGAPGRVWTPGLFDGTAGIGLGMLRLAHPQRVGSVLVPGLDE